MLAVVLTTAIVVAGATTVLYLAPALEPTEIPDAMLDAGIDDGWIVVAHRGGDPIEDGRIRTTVDGVPWTHGPTELLPGATVNVSRPVDPSWQVRAEVLVDGSTVHEELIRPGTRNRSLPDLRPRASVDGHRFEATAENVGASPTPDGRQTIVYFRVDGEDPSETFGWSSNRNHTPDPVPPGGSFSRLRRFDPSALEPGTHTLTVVVNVNAAGDPNLAETDYTNNEATTRFQV